MLLQYTNIILFSDSIKRSFNPLCYNSDAHHRSAEKRNSSSHKISAKYDSNKDEKPSINSASARLSGGEIEEMLRNTASSPVQSELSPSSADPPEPEELIKV